MNDPSLVKTAVVLAGGLGSRLGELTRAMPKCLIDVGGEPFAFHQLRLLKNNEIERVVFCVGHLGEIVRETVGDGSEFGLTIEYVFDGPKLLGTAGAIKRAMYALKDVFFVIYGDSYLPCDFARVLETFEESGKSALMTVFENHGRWDTSNVEFADGRIHAYDKAHRTARMRYIDYGLGLFHRRAFDLVPDATPFDLAELYQRLLSRQDLAAHEVSERFYEVGSISGLDETREYLTASIGSRR